MAESTTVRAKRDSTRPKGTGSRKVYEVLRRKILRLELKPGADLDEASIVKMLKVSRTPVREALIRLCAEDLVVLLPNRGARVAPMDLERVREFFEALDHAQRAVTHWAALRRTDADLEAMALALRQFERAAQERDADEMIEANRRFHMAIATAARNGYLAEIYDRLLLQGFRFSRIAFSYSFEFDGDHTLASHLGRVMGEHSELLTMIERRDAQGAEQLAGAHAELALERLLHNMASGIRNRSTVPFYGALAPADAVPRADDAAPVRRSRARR